MDYCTKSMMKINFISSTILFEEGELSNDRWIVPVELIIEKPEE